MIRESTALTDQRILLVEDDPMLLMALEHMMLDFGCNTVGTAMTVDTAFALALNLPLDLALLDVNLHGELVTPVALLLAERKVPFIFATAYSAAIEPSLADRPLVSKPYRPEQISSALASVVRGQASNASGTDSDYSKPSETD